jgi:hypothetical protein
MSLNCLIEFLQDAVANCVQISGWREPTVVDEFRFEKSRVDAMLVELAALKTMEGQKPPTNNASHVIVLQKEALKYLNKLPKSINAAKVELLIKDSIARLQAIA